MKINEKIKNKKIELQKKKKRKKKQNLLAMQETLVQFMVWEDVLEKG